MRFSITISRVWRPLFRLFGFSAGDSFVDLDDRGLDLAFGTAREQIAWDNIDSVAPRAWPFYYGLGPKLGPDGGVAYVGSTEGVVQIRLRRPQSLAVWAFFRKRQATSVTLSVSEPEAFLRAVTGKLGQPAV